MNSTLILFCILVALASWLGGWIPASLKLGHRQTQLVLSLVSGVMLGVAMLHLLPQAVQLLNDEFLAMAIGLGGLLFMFFMIRMFPFHYHDTPGDGGSSHTCDHEHHSHEIRRSDVSWLGLAFGFSVHTMIEGVALAAASTSQGSLSGIAGLGVFLAILLHKPLDAMTITSLMAVRGWSVRKRTVVNTVYALMCPLGALLFVSGISGLGQQPELVFGSVLAFSAGVFLCISLSDLLPEVQFHSHDRLAMSGALLLGVAVALVLEWLPL